MSKLLQLAIGLGVLGSVCAAAQAQRLSRRVGPVVVSAPAGTRIIQAARPHTSSTLGTIGVPDSFVVGGVGAASVETLVLGNFPVPGFGFDFTHHAAVNRNIGIRAVIDPVIQHRLALARQIRRETPAFPFVLPAFFNTTNIIIVPQPPVVILPPQPAPPEEPVAAVEPVRNLESEVSRPAAPVVELGELALVRNDGRVVFAVAFSAIQDQLVYITREGVRRSFALAELDAEATRRINEEQGTALRLP